MIKVASLILTEDVRRDGKNSNRESEEEGEGAGKERQKTGEEGVLEDTLAPGKVAG